MNAVSIGYERDDGDFHILATLNNNDGELTDAQFVELIRKVESILIESIPDRYILTLNREDTPDYVYIGE